MDWYIAMVKKYDKLVQRIHTHVHMMKWRDSEMVWCGEYKGEMV